MTNPFGTLATDARSFFSELAQNNTRDWFTDHKDRYETLLKAPAAALLEHLSPQVSELSDAPVKTKLFRIHRDIRFSKDKTPYNLHLHMAWMPQGTGAQPAYFLGISLDYLTAGAGIMTFDKAQLAEWRNWTSEREGAALQTRIDACLAAGGRMDAPQLKRVPAAFGQDHPNGALLRRKGLVLWKDIDGANDLPAATLEAFALVNPVMEDLRAFL